jgi:hypothetical protein
MTEIFNTLPLGVVFSVTPLEYWVAIGPGRFGAASATVLQIPGRRIVITSNQSLTGTTERSHSPQEVFLGLVVMALESYKLSASGKGVLVRREKARRDTLSDAQQ